jgi:hypothetical protein
MRRRVRCIRFASASESRLSHASPDFPASQPNLQPSARWFAESCHGAQAVSFLPTSPENVPKTTLSQSIIFLDIPGS